MTPPKISEQYLTNLKSDLRQWASDLGFADIGVSDIDLSEHEQHLNAWLEQGFHGDMEYLKKHGTKRSRPEELIPGTLRVIAVRMDHLPPSAPPMATLKNGKRSYIARYALGRDYHKLMRKRLAQLAKRIETAVGDYGYRVFCDSAPVLEKAIAEKAGLGWIGKHTLLLNRHAGSWFFLGEIYTDLPLEPDQATTNHCGSCQACIDICPTQAILGPMKLDARRCIAYLTIEYKGSIPVELRRPMGNRIFGCDDCQLVCPWNRYAKVTAESDFHPRQHLDTVSLLEAFLWDEASFLKKTEGSAIRRAGYEAWQRNIAVALGNAPFDIDIIKTLEKQRETSSDLVKEHIDWALEEQQKKRNTNKD